MANLDNQINGLLGKMTQAGGTGKGTYGEQAVFKVCEEFYQTCGGILIHSYSYNVDQSQAGNIKKNDGKLYVERLGSTTEIDVLYVSKYRVFPIEVKAYKANTITLTDDGISGCYKTDKSPVHQNEMHCRHLYAHIFKCLPDGQTKYVVPIVCFVDRASIIDKRSDWQRGYILLTILDNLKETIKINNFPLEYQLNLTSLDNTLKEQMQSCEKYFPPRF